MSDSTFNSILVGRLVTLWRRRLINSTNVAHAPTSTLTEQDILGMGLMALVKAHAGTPEDTQLVLFGEKLTELLSTPQPYRHNPHAKHMVTRTCVDYNPDECLGAAADAAGIDHICFPIKTEIWLEDNCVGVSNGYAGEYMYHYPLSNDAWLITSLRGNDVSKIVAAINAGIDLGLTIERPVVPAA